MKKHLVRMRAAGAAGGGFWRAAAGLILGVVMAAYLAGGEKLAAGEDAAFARFHERAAAGERLTVAFLGGSLTWGARASDPQKTSYRALVSRRLEERYPAAHFRFVDAAIGGTGAQLGAFRLDRDVLAYRPDLVFLDFTLNDDVFRTSPGTLAAQEALIRRIITEAHCPVIQMFLASRDYVTGEAAKMIRRTAHQQIAKAYHVPCADAIALMQERYRSGALNLDAIWPPESFDACHPCDKGYALYAQAAWTAFEQAVADRVVCSAPEAMLNPGTYLYVKRTRLSTLGALPAGWRTSAPSPEAMCFDFLPSRWMDEMTVARNFSEQERGKPVVTTPAAPLRCAFRGTLVALFGESRPLSGSCRIVIDQKEINRNTCQLGSSGIGRMWTILADDLDPAVEHRLEIIPLYQTPGKPQEVCIESICVAGRGAELRLLGE